MSVRGLHKLAGAAARLRDDALAGRATCTICPQPSVGYIESIGGRGGLIKPMCGAHALQGESLGYHVHRASVRSGGEQPGGNR